MVVNKSTQVRAPKLCMCGHPELSHLHYRSGTDCGTCGRSCARYRTPAAALAWILGTFAVFAACLSATVALVMAVAVSAWWVLALPLAVSALVVAVLLRRSLAEQLDRYRTHRALLRKLAEDADLFALADHAFMETPPDPRWDAALERLLAESDGPRT